MKKGFVLPLVIAGIAILLVFLLALFYFRDLNKIFPPINDDVSSLKLSSSPTAGNSIRDNSNLPDDGDAWDCDYAEKLPYGNYKFQYKDSYQSKVTDYYIGTLTLTGRISTRINNWWNSSINGVYLKIISKENSQHFIDQFTEDAKGGGASGVMENGDLLFRLGYLEGNEFKSHANIPDTTKSVIANSIDNGKEIAIRVVIAAWGGSDAPSDWTAACKIN